VQVLDVMQCQWSELQPSGPGPSAALPDAACVHQGCLYVLEQQQQVQGRQGASAGGSGASTSTSASPWALFKLDLGSAAAGGSSGSSGGGWCRVQCSGEGPSARRQCATFLWGGCIYVHGGQRKGRGVLGDLWRLELGSGRWEQVGGLQRRLCLLACLPAAQGARCNL
jgi:hypothetical protein